MIVSFKNRATQDLAYGEDTKATRRLLPKQLHTKAKVLMALLDGTPTLAALSSPGLKLEKLLGDRSGGYSIRINNKYRICFYYIEEAFYDVEVIDYH